jgi:hypothetical protein
MYNKTSVISLYYQYCQEVNMADVFDGSEGEQITSQEANSMKSKYQGTAGVSARQAVVFGEDLINSILNQEGCLGIRFYFAHDDDDKLDLVMVGVGADGNDIDDGIYGNRSTPCPPICNGGS